MKTENLLSIKENAYLRTKFHINPALHMKCFNRIDAANNESELANVVSHYISIVCKSDELRGQITDQIIAESKKDVKEPVFEQNDCPLDVTSLLDHI